MFNACNRTIFFTQILKFFKLLVKNTINISCAQITPSHKCDKNQLCKYCNKYCKTYIINYYYFAFCFSLKEKKKMNEKNFF